MSMTRPEGAWPRRAAERAGTGQGDADGTAALAEFMDLLDEPPTRRIDSSSPLPVTHPHRRPDAPGPTDLSGSTSLNDPTGDGHITSLTDRPCPTAPAGPGVPGGATAPSARPLGGAVYQPAARRAARPAPALGDSPAPGPATGPFLGPASSGRHPGSSRAPGGGPRGSGRGVAAGGGRVGPVSPAAGWDPFGVDLLTDPRSPRAVRQAARDAAGGFRHTPGCRAAGGRPAFGAAEEHLAPTSAARPALLPADDPATGGQWTAEGAELALAAVDWSCDILALPLRWGVETLDILRRRRVEGPVLFDPGAAALLFLVPAGALDGRLAREGASCRHGHPDGTGAGTGGGQAPAGAGGRCAAGDMSTFLWGLCAHPSRPTLPLVRISWQRPGRCDCGGVSPRRGAARPSHRPAEADAPAEEAPGGLRPAGAGGAGGPGASPGGPTGQVGTSGHVGTAGRGGLWLVPPRRDRPLADPAALREALELADLTLTASSDGYPTG
ncbi:hypothetical protein [Allostreptomyces psammosilenae]|uniref:Uncharacterized protein n=1 Tax=Allostreptomyces psammosilenae TaxID=1892865 RepID=A0A853AD74_9ACTN|nr:hypothetical protein [Allostreptomyces psammosilenae]NYI08282.1 hypothetical protein [Allostreptomyces psammosilenae]